MEATWIRLEMGVEGVQRRRGTQPPIASHTHVETALPVPELLESWRAERVICVRRGRRRSLRVPGSLTHARGGTAAESSFDS